MKIALIIDLWEPVTGGSQTHVRELSKELIKNHGCRIDIFTRALIDNEKKKYSKVEEQFMGRLRIIRVGPASELSSTWGRIVTLFSIAWKVQREHKVHNYDFIHAHSILGGLIGKFASILIRRPIIFTVHGSPNLDRGKKTFSYYIERFIHTNIRYSRVIVVGQNLTSHQNINKNIEIIPNGVDVASFDQIDDVTKGDYFKILFVGRLDWTKGIDTLINTLKILNKSQKPLLDEKKVEFHLVGYGFDAEKYKRMALDYNLGGLLFFRGKITGEQLIREYKSSHLFILPSITEGDSIVIKEAWAARTPVLSTICNAPEYYISEGADGFLVEKQNPEKMAESIVRILELPQQELGEMGEKGYKKVCKNYTWEMVAEKIFDVYASLAKH